MKRMLSLILIGLVTVPPSSASNPFYGLLEEADLEWQRLENARGPAMSSDLRERDPWKSYNQWQCFDRSEIELQCSVYDEEIFVPSLLVETSDQIFVFDAPVEYDLHCDTTLDEWNSVLGGNSEFCVYAALMPTTDMGINEENGKPLSLWYVERLKGTFGTWKLEEAREALRRTTRP